MRDTKGLPLFRGTGDDDFAPELLVYLPLLAVTALFVGATAGAIISGAMTMPSFSAVAIAIISYSAAIIALVKIGLKNIDVLRSPGFTDSLSQLPNRRALHAQLGKTAKDGGEVALALIDLDGFKLVNDHYGHFVGDQLIKDCAKKLQELCGDEADCFRLGGDEFVIAKVGPLAGTILEGICRNLIEELEKPFQIDDRRLLVSASIGLSRCAQGELLDSSELLRRSDVALYASKRAGKSRCTWFSPAFDRSREAFQELDSELRTAMKARDFLVLYQPLVDAQTGMVVAVESLIRWDRKNADPIGPNVFIPIAEESGLINEIGAWVLEQACEDALAWEEIKLSVNISAAQLRNPEFAVILGHILETTGFPPERLELEITETCLVLDPIVAERSLEVIKGFGVQVVLDDFGTGYASIGFLRQFDFGKLKLDRSLIAEAEADDASRAMMLSSVTVARAMKMDVTAEGVETEAQAALVRAAGCDQIQGWLYYKAMPAAEITELLQNPEARLSNQPAVEVRGRNV